MEEPSWPESGGSIYLKAEDSAKSRVFEIEQKRINRGSKTRKSHRNGAALIHATRGWMNSIDAMPIHG